MILKSIEMSRRDFATVLAVSAACAATSLSWAQSRPEKAKVSIAVEGRSALSFLPLTIAEQLGYFKAEGLDVETVELVTGARAGVPATIGVIDVWCGAYEQLVSLRSRGQKFQTFVLQGRAPAIALGISPKALPQYKNVADLKGRKIGISTLGSLPHVLVTLLLARAGLKPADVSFVTVGTYAGALAAFRAGQLDAISYADPLITALEQRSEIRLIADARTLKGSSEIFGGPMLGGCLYAPAEFVQKYPNTVQALTNAIVRSLKWLQTAGPGDIIKSVPDAYLLGDRALYLAAFNNVRQAISPDGLIPEEGPVTAFKALASLDPTIKIDKIELAQSYTNAFVNKAKERFKT